MQPSLLQNRSDEWSYRIRNFLSIGLIGGISSGLIGEMNNGIGWQSGISSGLIFGLFFGWPKIISPLERLRWSWQSIKTRFWGELFYGIGSGLIFGKIMNQILQGYPDVVGANTVLMEYSWLFFGLVFGLVFGLGSGLGSFEIEQRTVPNKGIQSSQRNCIIILIIGLIGGLIGGLIMGVVNSTSGSAISWLIFGLSPLPMVGLKYGGVACIKHLNLRWVLHKRGRIPWDYARFLDYASERIFLQKVGGGYIFVHWMLLEHFARMK